MNIARSDWGFLLAFYVLMNLGRGIMVLIFYPFLKYYAYGFDWKKVRMFLEINLKNIKGSSLNNCRIAWRCSFSISFKHLLRRLFY